MVLKSGTEVIPAVLISPCLRGTSKKGLVYLQSFNEAGLVNHTDPVCIAENLDTVLEQHVAGGIGISLLHWTPDLL